MVEWEELSARDDPPRSSASGQRPRPLPPQVGRGHGDARVPDWVKEGPRLGRGQGSG